MPRVGELRPKFNEAVGDLWTYPSDLIVITTNPIVTRDGRAVMGRGSAREARDKFKYPDIDLCFGGLIKRHGCLSMIIREGDNDYPPIACFPVKWHWRGMADLSLINRSAGELLDLVDEYEFKQVVMPRPGCGNGRLKWSQVRPILATVLDERFTVLTKGEDHA